MGIYKQIPSRTSLQDFTAAKDRITTLEEKYVISTRFQLINSGTTGTIALPSTSSQIIYDDFGGALVDALISEVSSSRPTHTNALTSGGAVVATTLDANRDFILSGTPASYPVAIIFRIREKLIDFDGTDTNIIGEYYISSGTTLAYTPEDEANKVTAFQATPDDTHYPSEKLVNDTFIAQYNPNKICVVDPYTRTCAYYTTIQAAINSITAATSAATARCAWELHIPTGAYDEDLTFELSNRRINLFAHGVVSIGLMTGSAWGAGGTARNITINVDGTTAEWDAIRAGLAITTLCNADQIETAPSNLANFKVSGAINITSSNGAPKLNLCFYGVEAYGSVDATNWGNGVLEATFKNCRFRSTVGVATNKLALDAALNCRFAGKVTVTTYGQLSSCVFDGGFTTQNAAASSSAFVQGFYNCSLKGTFTAPSGGLKLDSVSNYWSIVNSITLAGGATKVYLDAAPLPQYTLSALNTAPSAANATGTLGEIRFCADAIYLCTATNTWIKVAMATW